jgi:acetyl esterase/lipase
MTEAPWNVVREPTAYDNATFIPGGDAYFPRWRAAAAAFRDEMGARARLGIGYGAHPREAFDLFLPEGPPAGLFVFVHGGFWRMSGREDWSHLARGALGRGWAAALPSYPLAPEVRLAAITGAVARALPAMAAEVPGPLALAGHSAGGHLVLRMACADAGLPEATRARISGILAISPLADLEPLRHMPSNADWRIDTAEAETESPRRHVPPDVPVAVVVGGDERPAFVDQARWMAAAWPAARLGILPGRHHFDVVEPLEDPSGAMLAALLG